MRNSLDVLHVHVLHFSAVVFCRHLVVILLVGSSSVVNH